MLKGEVVSKTAKESWSEVGGPGSIAEVGNRALIVLQTPAIHREVEKAFGKRLVLASAPPDRVAALAPTKGVDPLAKMRDLLRRPESVEFPETPFQEAVE